ncbi:MAG TPA: CobD/CbiB family protein [Burkholderiales bacterium]|nr:CobD/CbiB family protein [Burkholderiales bacterium]
MNLISLVLALLIEQLRPLPSGNVVHSSLSQYISSVARQFNSGERRQGVMAWLVAVLPWVLGIALLHSLLDYIGALLELAFNVAVLYFLIGFRQFGSGFNSVLEALRNDDANAARQALADWRNQPADELESAEVAKLAIEDGLIGAQRHLFGVIFWFVVLPGPVGAVLYFLSAMLVERWGLRQGEEYIEFGRFARQAFEVLDWIPARLTAITFAIVGNFEDAVYCWRTQSNAWGDPGQGAVLSAGAGALGVRLGDAIHENGTVVFRPELGLGDAANADNMASAIDLVRRSVLIWLFLIALVTMAFWIG